MDNKERRLQERFFLQLKAELSTEEEGAEAPVIEDIILDNISSGGAFIITQQKFPMASKVYVEFTIDFENLQKLRFILSLDSLRSLKGKQVRVKAGAIVIRAEKNGVGIIFDTDYQLNPMQVGKPDLGIISKK